MSFLGIDQSLTSPGFALLTSNVNLSHLETKSLRGGERLEAIYDMLRGFLDSTVTLAALEGYSIGSQNRPFDLGEVGGVVRLCLTQHRIPYLVVAPMSVKKFAGALATDKDAMRIAVLKKWQIDIPQDDECDAFVLAKVAEAYSLGNSTCRAELEVLKSLKNTTFEMVSTRNRKVSV